MKLFKSLFSNIKIAEEKFIESRVLIMILPVLLILVLILFSAPLLLNNQELREEIEIKFSNQLKAELKINGAIKTSLFPSPSVTFYDLYLRDLRADSKTIHLHSKKTIVKLSLFSIFQSKPNIKSIEIQDATMEVASSAETSKVKTKELIKLISQSQLATIGSKGISGNLFSIDKFNIANESFFGKINFNLKNFNLIYYSKLGNKKQLQRVNAETKFKTNSLIAAGNFYNHNILTNFSVDFNSAKTKKESSITLKSEIIDLLATGKFSVSTEKSDDPFENFTGNLDSKIFNLKKFYKFFISDNGYIFEKIRDSSAPILMTAIVNKQGPEIVIQDCEIKSQVINGVASITASYLDKLPIFDLDINLDYIDLDKIFVEQGSTSTKKKKGKEMDAGPQEEEAYPAEKTEIDLDLSKMSHDLRDFDLNLELKINKAKYLFEEINEIDLYSSISRNGEILILPLKFKAPGNGNFRITGIFENRNDRPKFLGKLDATGESLSLLMNWLNLKFDNLKYSDLNEYSIYSDIFQNPWSTKFDNLYINIKNGPEILGESNLRYQSNSFYTISKIDILDLDISKFMQTSLKNTYLSPGPLLKKLLWINSINSRNEIEVSIDGLKYNNKSYDTNSFRTRFGKGYFEIDELQIESEDSHLSTSLAIEIRESISKFNLSLKSNKLIIDSSLENEINFKDSPRHENFSLTDTFFSLPSFEGFDGNLIVDLKDTKINDTQLTNFVVSGKLNNGILKFREFKSFIDDGKLNFSGSVAIKFDKSLSGNITLTKFPIKNLVSNLYQLDNIDGIANISAGISSFGSTKNEFISNLGMNSKFSTSPIKVNHYGLSSLVKKMFNFKRYMNELGDPKDILHSQLESTDIKSVTGTMSINRKREDFFKAKFSGPAFNGTIDSKFNNQTLTAEGIVNIIFLTGNKEKQIPINIASNFKGSLSNLEFNDNLSQAETYIQKARSFYSNPRNSNRSLLKVGKKKIVATKNNQLQKSQLINSTPNNPTQEQQRQKILEIMRNSSNM